MYKLKQDFAFALKSRFLGRVCTRMQKSYSVFPRLGPCLIRYKVAAEPHLTSHRVIDPGYCHNTFCPVPSDTKMITSFPQFNQPQKD